MARDLVYRQHVQQVKQGTQRLRRTRGDGQHGQRGEHIAIDDAPRFIVILVELQRIAHRGDIYALQSVRFRSLQLRDEYALEHCT